MPEVKIEISEDLIRKVEETAREQNRKPSELIAEAVRRYIVMRQHQAFAQKMELHARIKGIREGDIARLVRAVRCENEQTVKHS